MCCVSTRAQGSGNVKASMRVESERTCEEYFIYIYICIYIYIYPYIYMCLYIY